MYIKKKHSHFQGPEVFPYILLISNIFFHEINNLLILAFICVIEFLYHYVDRENFDITEGGIC